MRCAFIDVEKASYPMRILCRVLSRESHGQIIGEQQMVQEKIAESYASIRMLRLFVLETAWKIDNSSTQETRTDIAAVKYTMAKVLREVSFNALHILELTRHHEPDAHPGHVRQRPTHGHRRRRRRSAQGHGRAQCAEAHYEPYEGFWPTEYIPAKREKAWEKFVPMFEQDPGLLAIAEGYKRYIAKRG